MEGQRFSDYFVKQHHHTHTTYKHEMPLSLQLPLKKGSKRDAISSEFLSNSCPPGSRSAGAAGIEPLLSVASSLISRGAGRASGFIRSVFRPGLSGGGPPPIPPASGAVVISLEAGWTLPASGSAPVPVGNGNPSS